MSSSEIVQYKADNGQDITVTEQDVRDLMAANGNAMDNVTSQEVKMFLRLCQSQRLNPFTRDAYIVKYGNQPATVIAGKDAFVKRATRNKKYRGHEAGITVMRLVKRNQNSGVERRIDRREGSMLLEGETLIGGWCKVYLDGYACPIFDEVALSEYSAPDKYGKNGWSRMPATMIRKVALCHALREAFPEDLGGLYGAEEMDQANSEPRPTPQQPQEDQELEVIVEDVVVEEPAPQQPQEDPRKALWAQTATLKARVLELGANEEGIKEWMKSSIKNEDGSPKETPYYTTQDIQALCEYLTNQVRDLEYLESQRHQAQQDEYQSDAEQYDEATETNQYYAQSEMDLADHDIPF